MPALQLKKESPHKIYIMIAGIICLVGFLLVAAGAGYTKRNGALEGVGVWFLIIGFILIIVGGGLAFYM